MFMKLILLGDKNKNYNGEFKCCFIDGDETYCLSYDLSKWDSIKDNGLFGGEYYETYRPKPLKIIFDKEYDISKEDARKSYEILFLNGWR